MMNRYSVDLCLAPEQALEVLRVAVEESGGVWTDEHPEQFAIPVSAGIRQGYARIRPEIEPSTGGSRLQLSLEEEMLGVHTGAAMVLLFGAVGGILVVIWPLHPVLLSLAPIGALLAAAAWLLVVSRLRSYGPEDLLLRVAEIAESPPVDS